MKSYVYLDVLFVINLVVNYLMLLAAGKMMGIAINTRRTVAASCLGGVYSAMALVVPLQSFFSLPARFLFGLFMVALSYPKVKGLSFVALSGSFYLCSALVAGTSMGLYAWSGARLINTSMFGQGYSSVHWWTLAPVSYTHLDVYKRQVFIGEEQPGSETGLAVLESILAELEEEAKIAEYIDLRFDKQAVKLK